MSTEPDWWFSALRAGAARPLYWHGADVGEEPYTDPEPPQPQTLAHAHDPAWPTKETPMEPDEITVRDALFALEDDVEGRSGLDTERFKAACAGLYSRRAITVQQPQNGLGAVLETWLALSMAAMNEAEGAAAEAPAT